MFINFTNHSSDSWSADQKQSANIYGKIVDVTFPDVDAEYDEEDIRNLADKYIEHIIKLKPDCVLCQGEFTLSYAVIKALLSCGIRVVAACSKRNSKEIINNGVTKKISEFRFYKFREYR